MRRKRGRRNSPTSWRTCLVFTVVVLFINRCLRAYRSQGDSTSAAAIYKAPINLETQIGWLNLRSQAKGPPRTIWTFWDGDPPKFVRVVAESWKLHNYDYEIRVLDPDTLKMYLGTAYDEFPSPELRTDLIRLRLLYSYGGVWLDSSVILFEGIDDLVQWDSLDENGFRALYNSALSNPGHRDVIESWFLASYPHSEAIAQILIILEATVRDFGNQFTVENTSRSPIFIAEAHSWHVRLQKTLGQTPEAWGQYLLVYTVYTYLYHRHAEFREVVKPENFHDAVKIGYRLQYLCGWDMTSVAKILFTKHLARVEHKYLLSSKMMKISTKGALSSVKMLHSMPQNSFIYSALQLDRHSTLHRADFSVIVARFDEQLDWLQPYYGLLAVYNKGKTGPTRLIDPVYQLPNVGRESHTFVTYILRNYHSLPEYTAFVQGGIDDAHSWIRKDYGPRMISAMLKEAKESENGCSIALKAGLDDVDWGFEFDGTRIAIEKYKKFESRKLRTLRQFWNEILNLPIPARDEYRVYPSAFMVIRRDRIRSKSWVYYNRIEKELSYSSDPIEGHFMERSWYHIFGCK